MSEMNVSRSIGETVYRIGSSDARGLSADSADLRRTVDGYHSGMKPVSQIRRDRLAQLIREDFDGLATKLAIHTDKDRRQISAWQRHKHMRDGTAREIEAACGKPAGWLDHESEEIVKPPEQMRPASQSERINRAKMRDATYLVGVLGELQNVPEAKLDPDSISIAYEFLVEFNNPLTESNVLDMAKRLAARIRGEHIAQSERSSAA